MENLVVTFETAKKLEAAEFPTDPALAWFPEYVRPYFAPYNGEDEATPAWTAQEIADNWPGGLDNYHEQLASLLAESSNNLAEGLALLWLKLQEAEGAGDA